jgi:hypothetical protein
VSDGGRVPDVGWNARRCGGTTFEELSLQDAKTHHMFGSQRCYRSNMTEVSNTGRARHLRFRLKMEGM